MRPLTRLCSILLLSREALLACPPFPSGILPSFTVESMLYSSCSRSNPFFSRQGSVLAHLTIWYFDQTALFLLFLAKTALAYLPNALSVELRLLFPFWQAQCAQVFPVKPAPFCKLFAGLGSTNRSAISRFLLSDSRCVLSSIFSFTSISLAGTVFSPPVLSGYNGSADTRFSHGTTWLMSWPD